MIRHTIICCLLLASSLISYADNQRTIDSLQQEIDRTVNDTARLSLYRQLSAQLKPVYLDKALIYTHKAYTLAQELHLPRQIISILDEFGTLYRLKANYERSLHYYKKGIRAAKQAQDTSQLAKIFHNTGKIYEIRGEPQEAIQRYQHAHLFYKNLRDTLGMANTLNNIGTIHKNTGDYKEASQAYFTALKYHSFLHNQEGIAQSLNHIGDIYLAQDDLEKALTHFKRALKIKKRLTPQPPIANILNNMATVYREQGKYAQSLQYQKEALSIEQQENNQQGIVSSYIGLGLTLKLNGNLQRALDYFQQSLSLARKLDYKQKIIESYQCLGDIKVLQQQPENAIKFYNKARQLANETGNKKALQTIYLQLSKIYAQQNKHQKAYHYHQLYSSIKDSIISIQKAEKIAQLQTKYETTEKEKQIKLLKKQREIQNLRLEKKKAEVDKQQLLRNASIGGLILLLVIIYILYNRYKIKHRANQELSQKNKQIEKQRNKILDSINYAKRIQDSIMLDESEIRKYLPDSFIFFKPREAVSGDFYWFTRQNDRIYIAAVDCTGHGVPGGFMSMIGNMLLNEIVNGKKVKKPGNILKHLHDGVQKALQQKKNPSYAQDGMDISLCVIDNKENQIEFAGAKNPLYIVHNQELHIIEADFYSIGGWALHPQEQEQINFSTQYIPIKEGMTTYLFSDGYMDQFGGEDNQKFGIQQFKKMLVDHADESVDTQKQTLARQLENWQNGHRQIDDILVMGIKF